MPMHVPGHRPRGTRQLPYSFLFITFDIFQISKAVRKVRR